MVNKVSAEIIEKYQEILRKDPLSKTFAALADAYRDQGLMSESEALSRNGIDLHPEYVGGYVALARLLCGQKRFAEALPFLKKAVQLSPENLMAYQLLGQAFVELQEPGEALKAHKMALFLNPLSERSRKAVERLETLSADQYDEDLFQMRPLPSALATLHGKTQAPGPVPAEGYEGEEQERKKERTLSLVDALIVRNELAKAQVLIDDLFMTDPEDPQVRKRWELLREDEEALDLRPLMSREKAVVHRQIEALNRVLRRLEHERPR